MDIESFTVVGIEARTSNALEMSGQGVIAAQWGRFLSEVPDIPNRVDTNTLVLYTDYESDEHGAYTYVIGAKVSSIAKVPEGMTVREVPAGRYEVFTSARGPLPQVVLGVWQHIWAQALPRSYRTDFELYDTRAANPADGQIEVYIGVK